MSAQEQRMVVEHLRQLARRLAAIEPGNVGALRREAARYPLDSALPDGVSVNEVTVSGVSCAEFIPTSLIPHRYGVYAHGGSFIYGDVDLYGGLVARLALAVRSRIIFVRYRLAPEHQFPAALDDVFSVYAETVRMGEHRSLSTAARWLFGDSCGCSLALGAAIMARERHLPLPDGLILLGALIDFTASGDSYEENAASDPIVTREAALTAGTTYLGSVGPEDPRASPLFADLRNLPPMLLQASSTEAVRDDSVRLAARAREAGVKTELQLWPNMVHDWHLFAPLLPEANEALAKIGEFVESVSGTQ
jgi:epsilon-lactone hydrolase